MCVFFFFLCRLTWRQNQLPLSQQKPEPWRWTHARVLRILLKPCCSLVYCWKLGSNARNQASRVNEISNSRFHLIANPRVQQQQATTTLFLLFCYTVTPVKLLSLTSIPFIYTRKLNPRFTDADVFDIVKTSTDCVFAAHGGDRAPLPGGKHHKDDIDQVSSFWHVGWQIYLVFRH